MLNRWQGPLGTASNPLGLEGEQLYEVRHQIADNALMVELLSPSGDRQLSQEFFETEEEAVVEFAQKHGWLVASCISPLDLSEEFLKKLGR